MFTKRITLFAGHYGSGKTNVSVNYAISLAKQNKKVYIYDMDIVNPYFRTIDAKSLLDKFGVEIVVSPFAETNVDIPAMNSASYKMVDDVNSFAVVDIGGDSRGALALGRFRDKIVEENNYEMLLVVNKYRPETRTIEGAIEIKEEIETACNMKFTGIVNDSNIGKDTTIETILESLNFVSELSKRTGLPIKFTAIRNDLISQAKNIQGDKLGVELIKYGEWQ